MLNKSIYDIVLMNDQNIIFGYAPSWKTQKSKNVNKLTMMNVQNINIDAPCST